MRVAQNNLTIEDVNKQPILNITSELLTTTGEIIVDADGKVYTTGKRQMIKKYYSSYTGKQIDEAVKAIVENEIKLEDLSQELIAEIKK